MLAVALLPVAAGGLFRRRPVLAGLLAGVAAVGLLFTLSRSTMLALAGGLVVLAVASRRLWPVAAAAATVGVAVVFALTVNEIAPTTHSSPTSSSTRSSSRGSRATWRRARRSSTPASRRSAATSTASRDGVRTVAEHPQGYGLGNAGATARRSDVDLKAGESNYAELGVETGVLGVALFVAWNLVLLLQLLRRARRDEDWAAAWLASALACVLALGIQTDAYGVPWLAYCLWAVAGAVVRPAPLRLGMRERAGPPAPARSRRRSGVGHAPAATGADAAGGAPSPASRSSADRASAF